MTDFLRHNVYKSIFGNIGINQSLKKGKNEYKMVLRHTQSLHDMIYSE